MGWPSTFTPREVIEDIGDSWEEQVVPIWGYEDLRPIAQTMLDTLNEHRPGEETALKDALFRFLNPP